MVKFATVALIESGGHVCLCRQKSRAEFGRDLLVFPGGKIDANPETPGILETPKACVIREGREEVGLMLPHDSRLRLAGVLLTSLNGRAWWVVYVFHTKHIEGLSGTRPELEVTWWPKGELPYGQMQSSDELWVPKVLCGEFATVFLDYGRDEHELLAHLVVSRRTGGRLR